MLTGRHRLIVLYVILATVVGNIGVSVASGHPVSDVLYGILGTVAAVVLTRDRDGRNGNGGEPK